MAELLGTSVSNIKRAFIGTGEKLWFQNGKYKQRPDLVRTVLVYYSKHGKKKTIERFPEINVKCIVDRPEYYGSEKPKRQVRWTDEQIIEAVRMAGLVSPAAQARYFNRPGAHAGSIKSLWMKKFRMGGCSVNGMTHYYAKYFVNSGAKYFRPLGESRAGKPIKFRRMILWVDMEHCTKSEVPRFMANAIKTMAEYQRWLWRSDDPKPLIMKMIKEREINLSR